MNIKEAAWKWLQRNGTMYKGNNASDCMVAAFEAGAEEMKRKINAEICKNPQKYDPHYS